MSKGGGACFIACVLCLSLLCIILAISAFTQEVDNRRRHKTSSHYVHPAQCNLLEIEFRRTKGRRGCIYAHYLLSFFNETGAEFGGIREAYSNFFPDLCGGVMLGNASLVGEILPCYYKNPETYILRISPLYPRDKSYLTWGLILLLIGGMPLILFVLYNIILCCGAGCGSGTPPRDHEAEARASFQRRRWNAAVINTAEPVELRDVEDHDPSWFDRFANNAYAQAVLRRLRPSQDTASMSTEPTAGTEMQPVNVVTSNPVEEVATVEDCPICYEAFQDHVVLLACGHVFCEKCTQRLLRDRIDEQIACPECRSNTSTENIVRVKYRKKEAEKITGADAVVS